MSFLNSTPLNPFFVNVFFNLLSFLSFFNKYYLICSFKIEIISWGFIFRIIFEYILVKTLMEYSFTNENRINGNNETIEMFTNDVILEEKYEEMKMCKQKQVGIHKMLLKN